MSSWEEPGINTLVPPVVKPDQPRGQSVGTVHQSVGTVHQSVGTVHQPVGTVRKGEKRVKLRGWLAFGVFFLTTAIGYGLMFMMIDNWLKG